MAQILNQLLMEFKASRELAKNEVVTVIVLDEDCYDFIADNHHTSVGSCQGQHFATDQNLFKDGEQKFSCLVIYDNDAIHCCYFHDDDDVVHNDDDGHLLNYDVFDYASCDDDDNQKDYCNPRKALISIFGNLTPDLNEAYYYDDAGYGVYCLINDMVLYHLYYHNFSYCDCLNADYFILSLLNLLQDFLCSTYLDSAYLVLMLVDFTLHQH